MSYYLNIKPYNKISNLSINQIKNLAKKTGLEFHKIESCNFKGIQFCATVDNMYSNKNKLQAVYEINGKDFYIDFEYWNSTKRKPASGKPIFMYPKTPNKFGWFIPVETINKVFQLDGDFLFQYAKLYGKWCINYQPGNPNWQKELRGLDIIGPEYPNQVSVLYSTATWSEKKQKFVSGNPDDFYFDITTGELTGFHGFPF